MTRLSPDQIPSLVECTLPALDSGAASALPVETLELLHELEDMTHRDFVERIRNVSPFLAALAFFRRSLLVRTDELDSLIDHFDALPTGDSGRRICRMLRLLLGLSKGNAMETVIKDLYCLLETRSECPLTPYVDCVIWQRVARLERDLGKFREAYKALKECAATVPVDPWSRFYRGNQRDRGFLAWATGRFDDAIRIHTDSSVREAARQRGDRRFLAQSHMSAAKCAIDANKLTLANFELGEAKEILDENPFEQPLLGIRLLIFSGELDWKLGNTDEALDLFEYSLERLESFFPVQHAIEMEARIGVFRVVTSDSSATRKERELRGLLALSASTGCAASRANVLSEYSTLLSEASVDSGIERVLYDTLSPAAHLVLNPFQAFKAYSSLYQYARRFLGRSEAMFWLHRLRLLQERLEPDSYSWLYRKFVLERYREEVEGPLECDGLPPGYPDDHTEESP